MNEIKQLIEESVSSLFQSYQESKATGIMESGAFPEEMWSDYYAGGWTRMALPEEDGGAGMGLAGVCVLARIAGYNAIPLPIIEPMIATHLLALAGLPVPGTVLTVAVVAEETSLENRQPKIVLPRVPWARHAGTMVVVSPVGSHVQVGVVDSSAMDLQQHDNIAGEPRDDVTLDISSVNGLRELPGISIETVVAWLALGRAAQMSGSLEKVLEQTTSYANERRQFGKPIGKFQTIQHQIAVLAEQVSAAGCAVDAAILHLDTAQELECIMAAKIAAGEAAGVAGRVSHAVHGAIGFTEEFPLQLDTRRLWSWRDEYGNEVHWAAKLGERCLDLEDGGLWPWLTEQTA